MAIQRTPEEYKAAYVHHKSQGNLDKAKRVANLYRETLQPKETDNAFEYSVNNAQQLLGRSAEVAGNLVGNENIANYGTEVIAQQEQDLAKGGYQSPSPK